MLTHLLTPEQCNAARSPSPIQFMIRVLPDLVGDEIETICFLTLISFIPQVPELRRRDLGAPYCTLHSSSCRYRARIILSFSVVFVTSWSAFFVFRPFFFVIWNRQANLLLHDIVSCTINVNPKQTFRSICSLVNSLLYYQHPLQNIQQDSHPLPRIPAMVRH